MRLLNGGTRLSADHPDILISVKQKYLQRILNGKKTVELRRKRVDVPKGTRIWLYAAAPMAEICAYTSVRAIVTAPPRTIWKRYGSAAGLTNEEFNCYFAGSQLGCAILLDEVHGFEPALKLNELRSRLGVFHPPQFFKKLHTGSAERTLLRSHRA